MKRPASTKRSARVEDRAAKGPAKKSGQDILHASGPVHDPNLPLITVGVRFHDFGKMALLERCLQSIAAQAGVRVHVHLALQGFSKPEQATCRAAALAALDGSGFTIEIDSLPNPKRADLRSRLLNRIVERHYAQRMAEFLCFIDFDDIWFQHALQVLVEPLLMADFAVSYADIHCADVYYDDGQTYLRNVKDVFHISQKTKRDLLRGNFLPLHSYMFHTGRIDQSLLRYDESLERLEDFDVLLAIAAHHPFSGLHRDRLIGFYNFYQTVEGGLNTTQSVFATAEPDRKDDKWINATKTVISRHAGTKWQDFWGEEWQI
ncbi:hypothetical protein EU803_17420 [Loktanella sp. IMCC34160]|uniref:hypothetical protein n=1 Tax=Loktanella sp. IMCC34160 TaxID=2510646 RepID=UPI00101DEF12|nr:hypothetical protein [Loktanella sp. IMCC34160]RYG89510.1 hypothetical protein EU803_17420 [Loktanella sp. IMCC34160]